MRYCMVVCTCDSQAETHTLGAGLVEAKLAACVQIHRVDSIYSWKEKIHSDPEFRLIIKTQDALYPEVEAYITTHHSYEVPQVVKVPVEGGLPDYLDWIKENTRG